MLRLAFGGILVTMFAGMIVFLLHQKNIISSKDSTISELRYDIEVASIRIIEQAKEYDKRISQIEKGYKDEKERIISRSNDANATLDKLRKHLQEEARKLSENLDTLRRTENALRECDSRTHTNTYSVSENVSGGRTDSFKGIYGVDTLLHCSSKLVEIAEYADSLKLSRDSCFKLLE